MSIVNTKTLHVDVVVYNCCSMSASS